MIDIELEDLVANIFQEDLKENGRDTYISQIAIITIKSLVPARDTLGNKIDYRRFGEELKLWRSYRSHNDRSLINQEDYRDPQVYFSKGDRTLAYRIIPIVVGNSDFSRGEEEVIKNILFTSGKIEDLFEGLLLARSLYSIIEGKTGLVDDLKDYLIKFSQKDFLDFYRDSYRIDPEAYAYYPIEFERKRIEALNILNGMEREGFDLLKDLVTIVGAKEGESLLARIIFGSKKDPDLNGFYQGMASYIVRLRKSRIEPERLVIKEYVLPDIFTFEEGEVFFHSLLNQSKVIKKEVSKNLLTSTIQSKTGMYRFKRDLN